jgi:Mrp family chromosome partitioning ATPase
MNTEDKPLAGQRIGIFGRGGSGKSTCTVLLAKALAQAGYAVCVVDADSTKRWVRTRPRIRCSGVRRDGVQRRAGDLSGG